MQPDPAYCLALSARAVARDAASFSALPAAGAIGQSAICSTLKSAPAASRCGCRQAFDAAMLFAAGLQQCVVHFHRKFLQRFRAVSDRRTTPRRAWFGRSTGSEAVGPATASLRRGPPGRAAGRPRTGASARHPGRRRAESPASCPAGRVRTAG